MRKTKIVCTLGPSTDKKDVLEQLIKKGMNVVRCNFSHADYEEDVYKRQLLRVHLLMAGQANMLLHMNKKR